MKNNDPEKSIILNRCVPFLNSIGIGTLFRKIDSGSFLPGLLIEKGSLIVDEGALQYPGDILHEAGHIAVVSAASRSSLDQQSIVASEHREAEEMMAIAWSYAACIHLELDAAIVFHEDGYQGGGKSMIENFRAGRFLGTPMLQWCKMTIEPGRGGHGEPVFPKMLRWMRE